MYSWDPRDPRGMMFAYPIGEAKDVRIQQESQELGLILTYT